MSHCLLSHVPTSLAPRGSVNTLISSAAFSQPVFSNPAHLDQVHLTWLNHLMFPQVTTLSFPFFNQRLWHLASNLVFFIQVLLKAWMVLASTWMTCWLNILSFGLLGLFHVHLHSIQPLIHAITSILPVPLPIFLIPIPPFYLQTLLCLAYLIAYLLAFI